MKPKFFSSPEQFRQWLEQSHDSAEELLVGFHKKDSGKKSEPKESFGSSGAKDSH